ncbi:GNAT family N-acetyltransferase [Bordetella hinzii]|uniref:GNAT family N-acetyltransferase n=1 Tax=Bordetella hinzii TaxID=103855 RepID=UPI0039FBAD61
MMLQYATPDFVTAVMRHPRVWGAVREDGISPLDFSYQEGALYFQLGSFGFVLIRPVTRTMSEIHVATARGGRWVKEAVMACIAEVAQRGIRKLMAPIGDWNKAAIRLAVACGFSEEGRVSGAYVRNGVPRAMVLMGRTL